MDPEAEGWADAYTKAKEFVSQMTLLEKVNLTTGVGWESEVCVGNVGTVPRLGLHSYCMQDSPVGIRFADWVSVFPSGQTTAATFDRNLMYQRGHALGQENKDKGVTATLGPVAGPLGRAPAGGRNWEGFAPDPVLTGIGMAETIKGIQDAGVIATAKHFIANEQEHFRQAPEAKGYHFNITESVSSNVDDRTLHELYLWPFADAIRAGVGAVMCSYNLVNNSYSCQNSKLMNGILKGELGFQGMVMSDWSAQHTGVAGAVAGLDMAMPGDTAFNTGLSFWGANLTLAVLNGTMPLYRLDDMAMRIMAAYFKVGLTLDEPEPNFSSWSKDTYGYVHASVSKGYQQINWHVDVRGENANVIRQVAAKGTVLLKNTGSLPLNKPKFLAVVGEDAGPNQYGPNGCANRGCDNGTLAMGWGSGTADFPYIVTPDTALQNQALADGSRYESILDNYATSQIKSLVTQAYATAIVFVNADSGEGFINVDGNEGDRKNLTLWNNGDNLIKNVSSWNNNTIVVIHSVGPTLVTDWYDHPNITAIVWAGLPGQESGNSLVDVLYGSVNPAGRTPFTWGATRESYGADLLTEPNNGQGSPQQDFTEGVFIDYRYFDKTNATPIYAFGYGLSYTTFSYSNLQVTKSNTSAYVPTTGYTAAAPTIGTANSSTDLNDYLFPSTLTYVREYIYPYLNTSSSAAAASKDPYYGQTADQFLPPNATSASPIAYAPASGGSTPGGNAQLYDVLYTVTADITNDGALTGDEVPQLYVSLGGPDDPPVQLRGFDRIEIEPGATATFTVELTRRDLSNWDTASQDWVISSYPKTVYVGRSSRKLDLQATLT
ncbi:hypothetical protein VMCG_00331 [Cytospora schulzeri]|uniref:Beta-glucosidase cel3A n=1 Tax=Cytospora schulzeri TaxID=448051 RepID=A0A423X9G5_9PEZI|nr:hypothetical protein VMCG_00331 [Valsa malicola]